MKTVNTISEGTGYTAITVGNMANLNDFMLTLSPEINIPGKVFIGGKANATGAEVSFQVFEPGVGVPFLHTHKTHEEIYIFIKGSGEFQIDGVAFPIAEGTVVRVAPEAKRTLHNTGNESMVMICIQYKANTFNNEDAHDGVILNEAIVW